MSWYAIACIILASWIIAAAVVTVPVGRMIRRRDEVAPEPEPCNCESPLYLEGFELDARFYGVLADGGVQ